MNHFCTYFDCNYIDKGLALYQSMIKNCTPFTLWILCMDEITFDILSRCNFENIRLISHNEFIKDDTRLQLAKQNRTLIEYYFTCTPALLSYILEKFPEVLKITYVDADQFFYSSFMPLLAEMDMGSILIIEHRFPPFLKNLEKYGKFNVGLIIIKNDTNGLSCIKWWKDRCIEWCYDRPENGLFADQKYLDEWPNRFEGVVISQNKGVGLAPWNLATYPIQYRDRNIFVNQDPLMLYHFAGLKKINKNLYDLNFSGYRIKASKFVKMALYKPYIDFLHENQNFLAHRMTCSHHSKLIRGDKINFENSLFFKFGTFFDFVYKIIKIPYKFLYGDYFFVISEISISY